MNKSDWKPIDEAARQGQRVLVYVDYADKIEIAWYCKETGLWPNDAIYNDDGEPCNVGLPSHYMEIVTPKG